jgi:hypothetical protein
MASCQAIRCGHRWCGRTSAAKQFGFATQSRHLSYGSLQDEVTVSDEDLKPLIISTLNVKPLDIKTIVDPPRNAAGGRHYGMDCAPAKYVGTMTPLSGEERKL